MATFCTALIWGLGVSLGSAVGLLPFVGLGGLLGSHKRKTRRPRTMLTAETLDVLERLAEAIDSRGD